MVPSEMIFLGNYFILNCVFLCEYVGMSAGTHRGQTEVLGTELRFSVRLVHTLKLLSYRSSPSSKN